jgi:hypothetical protein
MKIGVSMNEYKKIEWIHKLINNNEIPIDELKTMQLFIEQIRENYFNKNGNLKNKWR